jgi:hypothetical protein
MCVITGDNMHDIGDIQEAIKANKDNGTPFTTAQTLVFMLENLIDDTYKRAKNDARLEIMTEIHISAMNTPEIPDDNLLINVDDLF